MSQRWEKLGQIYVPAKLGRHPKLLTHAANPLAVPMSGDTFRIFFSGRDESNRSSVGAVDIDIVLRRIVSEHANPFVTHGGEGSFYADGISIGNQYQAFGLRFILFMGWQAPKDTHWRGDIGRLILRDDLSLSIDQEAPFMGSDSVDPISLSYPWVHYHPSSGFQMWYGSTLTWDAGNGEMIHVLNRASSEDGQIWSKHGLAVPFQIGQAQAFSRPSVVQNPAGDYDMWFSYRSGQGSTYRIGRARSMDGANWTLMLDESGIDVSQHGWDSEMIEYPFVFDHAGERYMLYNGNGYGRTGFGLARWIDE